jgi:hypothetical protein
VHLSGEEWTRLESGELLAIRDGRVIMEENSSGDREICHKTTALLSPPL